ncbi:hypothetical protein BASA50_010773 [Batrachochytrium salamandrivorans]|uniref:Uncharacterized protein n=1 Tax=Batrachochytrium salamandrivorans TaxID=1357716 RepID=A0ABQ8EXM7_9FUNG|nr:hypothetical protein BASA60_005611 [Batrachochytrium salamandrivorans]KAH6588371.1 hypothetical protein BASA50_010773 [Batrachochytrium salamandrivorans]
MFSATATATATTTTPSLLKQFWTQCKVLLSVFSPCGSSALSEELTAKRVWNSASNPPISSVISKVTASIHNVSTDKKMRQMMDSKSSKEVTKVDSGVQIALPMETCNPSAKDVCVDWFKCTNITLTGVCTQPTLYMLVRLSDGTIQIKYNDGDEDTDYPVLSIDYHSITSFEIFKCGRWRSKKLWAYDCRVVMTIPDKMTPRKNKVLTIWMHGSNESVALAKHVLELSICPPLCFIMSTHYDLANPIP